MNLLNAPEDIEKGSILIESHLLFETESLSQVAVRLYQCKRTCRPPNNALKKMGDVIF